MNIADKLADKLIGHEINLMRVEAKERKKIFKILFSLEKEIKKELHKYEGIVYIQDPPHKKRLEKKLISVKHMIKEGYQDIYKSQQMLFKELVEHEWKFAQSSIYNTIGISVNITVPSIELLKSLAKDTLIMGSLAKDKWAIQANNLYTKVGDQIRMGLLLGEAPAQLSRRIAPGVTGAARRNATALARTSFHGVVQRARFESYQGLEDVIKGYQWLSTLDGRTSLICISLSNNTWNLDYKPIMGTSKPFPGHPPLHWNCFIDGQVPIYTSKGWIKIRDIKKDDLVLTHKGRFRPVTEVLRKTKAHPEIYTITFPKLTGKFKELTVTKGHPVLVNDGWLPVEKIKKGDKIKFLAGKCEGCGKLIPHYRKYCSLSCKSEHTGGNWAKDPVLREKASIRASLQLKREYASGIRNPQKITEKAHIKTREMVKDGTHPFLDPKKRSNGYGHLPEIRKQHSERMKKNNPMHIPAIVKKAQKTLAETYRKHPERHPNYVMAQKGFMSSLERIVKDWLDDLKIEYKIQHPINKFFADFAIPSLKLVIEVDGEYWHQDKEKEKKRDAVLKKEGWDIIHFMGNDINKNTEETKKELTRIVSNHKGDYEFTECEVGEVKKWYPKKGKTLYNFSVEEDESYIAKGFVVHNCRSTFLPLIRSFKELKLNSEIGGKIKELPKSTQASLDGYVASDMTYLDWLKNQSYAMQKKVLGSNRRRMWVDGKLEAKDLIDQSYRPLTLKELKNR